MSTQTAESRVLMILVSGDFCAQWEIQGRSVSRDAWLAKKISAMRDFIKIFKNQIELFSTFLDESRDTKNPTNIISIVYFQQARLFTAKIFTDEYYPSGYFLRTGTIV